VTLYDPHTVALSSSSNSASSGYTTEETPLVEEETWRAPSATFSLADCLPGVMGETVDESFEELAPMATITLVEQFDGERQRRAWHRALKLVCPSSLRPLRAQVYDPVEVTAVHAAVCLREQRLQLDVAIATKIYSRLDPIAPEFDRTFARNAHPNRRLLAARAS